MEESEDFDDVREKYLHITHKSIIAESEVWFGLEELGVDTVSMRFPPKYCTDFFLKTVAGITKGSYPRTYTLKAQWIMEYLGEELYGDDTLIKTYHKLNKELSKLCVFNSDSREKHTIKALGKFKNRGDSKRAGLFVKTVKKLVFLSESSPVNDGMIVEAVGNILYEDHKKFITACKNVSYKREAILDLSKKYKKDAD